MDENNSETDIHKGTGFLNVIKSTLAAACGVQTKANRDRDFTHGKPSTFIIAGIVFVIVFVLGMYGIVQMVMSLAS